MEPNMVQRVWPGLDVNLSGDIIVKILAKPGLDTLSWREPFLPIFTYNNVLVFWTHNVINMYTGMLKILNNGWEF